MIVIGGGSGQWPPIICSSWPLGAGDVSGGSGWVADM